MSWRDGIQRLFPRKKLTNDITVNAKIPVECLELINKAQLLVSEKWSEEEKIGYVTAIGLHYLINNGYFVVDSNED